MKLYTVLLLYPQNIAAHYGENCTVHVNALTREHAEELARLEMCEQSTAEFSPKEAKVIAVFPGHLQEV